MCHRWQNLLPKEFYVGSCWLPNHPLTLPSLQLALSWYLLQSTCLLDFCCYKCWGGGAHVHISMCRDWGQPRGSILRGQTLIFLTGLELDKYAGLLASELQGSHNPSLCSTGVTSTCCPLTPPPAFYIGSGDQTQAQTLPQLALYPLTNLPAWNHFVYLRRKCQTNIQLQIIQFAKNKWTGHCERNFYLIIVLIAYSFTVLVLLIFTILLNKNKNFLFI